MRELVVISPEGVQADEIPIVERLVSAGLGRYHVRKPGWSREQLAQWLAPVPAEVRSRMVLHSHHDLIGPWGLFGRHWKDEQAHNAAAMAATGGKAQISDSERGSISAGGRFMSCSCHRLEDLRARVGGYDAIFFSPVFPSKWKPGRPGMSADELAALALFLKSEDRGRRRTQVIALSGITPERVRECGELGFDGVAVLGGIWVERVAPNALGGCPRSGVKRVGDNALHQYLRYRRAMLPAVMCLAEDAEQARQLCAAGAKFIQLRCKGLADTEWLGVAREVAPICHAHGALCIINDRPDIAVAVDADGAHVGKTDIDWHEARRILGPGRLLGGTVNNEADAERAVAAACLDYVGVGPLHFTTTKQKLAPVLGLDGVQRVIAALGDLPAWVIGGVQAGDLPSVRGIGAAGVAVSSALYRGESVETQFTALADAWSVCSPTPLLVS